MRSGPQLRAKLLGKVFASGNRMGSNGTL